MTAQILSMHAGTLSNLGRPHDTSVPPSPRTPRVAAHGRHHRDAMNPTHPRGASPVSPATHDDPTRGRRRVREADVEDDEHDEDGEGDLGPGSSRKRRRSRKGLDKKFECPHHGCGKSYSRAEHLYRHQLNHNPKQIYHCDFPDCQRSFVRQDLCARHKERHTARGSQLLRRETFGGNVNPIVTSAFAGRGGARPGAPPPGHVLQSPAAVLPSSATTRSDQSSGMDTTMQSPASDAGALSAGGPLHRSRSDENFQRPASHFGPQRQSSYGSLGGGGDGYSRSSTLTSQTATPAVGGGPHGGFGGGSFGAHAGPAPGYGAPPQMGSRYASPAAATYLSHHGFPPFSTLPPPGYATMTPPSAPPGRDAVPPPSAAAAAGGGGGAPGARASTAANARLRSVSEAALLEGLHSQHSVPVFGQDGYTRSPFAMADDFTAWLFNEANVGAAQSPLGATPGGGGMQNMMGPSALGLPGPYFSYNDPALTGAGYYAQQPGPPQQHPMAVHSILDTSLPETALSEEKRQSILDLINLRFNETDNASVRKQKEELLDGLHHDEGHVLSLPMMQTYVGSYWMHFHPQMPILHKPTFNADAGPDLLIIAMMSLGASCLEKSHGHQITQACSDLANFLAWHLRWEVFRDADFGPPAKLWVFQALLLLEIFEKMYATRRLHERAHIHHATTLTLMRRGSSLIGRSALDSPPRVKDAKPGGRNGSVGGGGGGPAAASPTSAGAAAAQTPDEWWNHWVTNEATRRCAFAAFIVDSIHATMFGHSAVMIAHEMRLPLPCDEELWAATSSAEVGRHEQTLHASGVKPPLFLDSLKRTLNNQPVRTNPFGRTIIMAGLLSVSWHMNQRDLQVSYLGVIPALSGRDRWRGALTRAFDYWRRNFDESLASGGHGTASPHHHHHHPPPHHPHAHHAHHHSAGSFGSASASATAAAQAAHQAALDDDNVFESRTVLHHLAHMAMHVDIVDCQILAGATRLLGRNITPPDSASAQKRMCKEWAPTARARDAAFYALKFLREVLIGPADEPAPAAVGGGGPRGGPLPPGTAQTTMGSEAAPAPSSASHAPPLTPSSSKRGGGGGGSDGSGPPGPTDYSARDDYLINRPWVLYFSVLVVWSYGYALDGPLQPPYDLANEAEHESDMQGFLLRLTSGATPDDLAAVQNRNACLGLLLVLRDMFKRTRWELLHEASALLGNCVDMLRGVDVSERGTGGHLR